MLLHFLWKNIKILGSIASLAVYNASNLSLKMCCHFGNNYYYTTKYLMKAISFSDLLFFWSWSGADYHHLLWNIPAAWDKMLFKTKGVLTVNYLINLKCPKVNKWTSVKMYTHFFSLNWYGLMVNWALNQFPSFTFPVVLFLTRV